MKRATWKRLSALVLALIMTFAMSVSVFADQKDNGEAPKDPATGGSIGDIGAQVETGYKVERVKGVAYDVYTDGTTEYLVKDGKVYAKTDVTTELETPKLADLTRVTAEEKDIQAQITKVIKTGVGTAVPKMSFGFKFEQLDTVDGYAGANDGDGNPKQQGGNYDSQGNLISDFVSKTESPVAIPDVEAQMTNGMTTADAGWEAPDLSYKTIAIPTKNFFENVTYTKEGVYAYKVTEYLTNTRADNYKVGTAQLSQNLPEEETKKYNDPDGNPNKQIYQGKATYQDVGEKGVEHGTTVEEIIRHDERVVPNASGGTTTYPAYDETIKEILEYSLAEYTIYVYVKKKSDDSGYYIYALGTVLTKDDGGKTYTPGTPGSSGEDPATGSKKDPTPWVIPGTDPTWEEWPGDQELTGNEMAFNNEYTKYKEGDTTPFDNPPDEQQQLTIKKIVTGDNVTDAERNKYFDFQVELGKTPSANETYYDAYIIEKENGVNKIVDPTPNVTDAGLLVDVTTKSGATVKAIRFTIGADGKIKQSIKLKDGQTLAFMTTPVGTRFNAQEDLGDGYKHWDPTADVWYNNDKIATITETTPILDASNNQIGKSITTAYLKDPADPASEKMMRLVGEDERNGADFTNEYTQTPPTGILMNNLGFFAMMFAAVAAFIMIAVIRMKARAARR